MPSKQAALFSLQDSGDFPEGFRLHENAIAVEHEAGLVQEIARLPLKEFQFRGFEGKRRVMSFGHRYDFNEHKLSPAEPIPAFLMDSYKKVSEASGFTMADVQQVLVTEYAPGAGIGWHKDRPVFDQVVGLSLVSPCVLRLRKPLAGKWERVSVHTPPRSAYFFEGPARWEWEHSIPPVEKLRYSVTFRNLRQPRGPGLRESL